jgi:hypothetical protein
VADLESRLEGYTVVDEAFHELVGEGRPFADPPSADEFRELVEYSIDRMLRTDAARVLFDRSPADYLAYLLVLDAASVDPDLVASVRSALATLDLVVLLSVEQPDRIAGPELPKLRARVDRVLGELFVDDAWQFAVPVVQVGGPLSERVALVAARVRNSDALAGRPRR